MLQRAHDDFIDALIQMRRKAKKKAANRKKATKKRAKSKVAGW